MSNKVLPNDLEMDLLAIAGRAGLGFMPTPERLHQLCHRVLAAFDYAQQNFTATDSAEPAVACADCGRPYGKRGWIEAVIPDKAWNAIRPEGCDEHCGILCIQCISERLQAKGFAGVPVWLCGMEPLTARAATPNDELELLRGYDPALKSAPLPVQAATTYNEAYNAFLEAMRGNDWDAAWTAARSDLITPPQPDHVEDARQMVMVPRDALANALSTMRGTLLSLRAQGGHRQAEQLESEIEPLQAALATMEPGSKGGRRQCLTKP